MSIVIITVNRSVNSSIGSKHHSEWESDRVELSSRIEYALLALLALFDWRLEGKPLKVSEIAAMQSIPERYLDQILILLRRCGVVRSQRGIKGGYLLAK